MSLPFDAIKIGLASADDIRSWSYGEVKKPETINYRTLKPEKDGLFCEKIFGPTKDWECHCGKYKKIRFKGKICERCGVEVTRSNVRRERMGHIELAAPVSHIWFFKGTPSKIALALDIPPKALEKVLYFASYIVLDPGDRSVTRLERNQVLSESEYRDAREKFGEDFRAGMGAESIQELLRKCDCDVYADILEFAHDLQPDTADDMPMNSACEGCAKCAECRAALYLQYKDEKEKTAKGESVSREYPLPVRAARLFSYLHSAAGNSQGQKKEKFLKRLEVAEDFYVSGNDPANMVLDVIPVIPPEIRPMVQLDGGRFATSDLNDLYRRVINRNNRLKRMIEMDAPDVIIRNEKRMLQDAVDALIDNGRRGAAITGAGKRQLKSLSDMLKGKQGRFRQNLLGKRVDYSGRSVIVVGPDLKLFQCGVPKEMAIELFRPFIMQKLKNDGLTNNIKAARRMVDRAEPEVWDALDVVIKEHPVLLNRAPTLHRLGIQAFEPVLVEGRALKLHPLVCTAYNADFDGDQMAIHLPLSNEAQAEARILMLSANNLLHPKDGKPVTVPTQDMILGSYYLTIVRENEPGAGRAFSSASEALMAYSDGQVGIHAPIRVRRPYTEDNGQTLVTSKLIETTVGRIFFNEPIPQDLGFVPRNTPEEKLEFEISFPVGKKQLEKIISACIEKRGFTESAIVLDKIKELGFKFSTRGAITISMSDMTIPEEKAELIKTSEKIVVQIENAFKDGLLTDDERYDLVTKEWKTTEEKVTDAVKAKLSVDNPIYMMSDSGARGSMNQIRQLIGMRGLMANTAGKTIEIPVKANFREGLTVLEYFISSRGARKGLADTALRTADSGYLTRRLVDVAQDIIIKSHDCGTHNGTFAHEERDSNDKVVRSFGAAIHGRFPVEDIVSPTTGEVLFSNNKLLNERDAELLEQNGIKEVMIRTVMDCEAKSGVCAKCYGQNLATGDVITAGEAVGIIAAQSIGEPGTQLTMRTFHTGGVAGDDITQGLPRVVELFEARSPKKTAIMAEISGMVEISPTPRKTIASITVSDEESGEIRSYTTPYNTIANIVAPDGKTRLIQTGDHVEKGAKLTTGTFAPVSILKILGKEAAQNYIIAEVQKMYREQSVDINDKHIEVIVRQMMRFLTVSEGGDTGLLPGQDISIYAFNEANAKLQERREAGEKNRFGEELRDAEGERRMLGITKASLSADSFLSSASFQETTRMLTDAAVKGKIDYLVGLKENVIVGKLMPAGSGLAAYRGSELEFGDDYTSDADEQFEVDMTALKEKYNV